MHPALREYLAALPGLMAKPRMSLFWERQLGRLRPYYDRVQELQPAELEALVAEGGYGFETLPDDVLSVRDDPELEAALTGTRRAARILKKLTPAGLEMEVDAWHHMRALYFLQKEELIDEYLAFIEPLRIRSSLPVARHWFYARQICGLSDRTHGEAPLDILEIGAGAGNLAYFLTVMNRVRSYCIIDLPEMLAHSAYTLQRYLGPSAQLAFDDVSQVGNSGCFVFLTNRRGKTLPDSSFDVALNLNSFMEMDERERDAYIRLVYRTGRPGALFYNVNRRQPTLPKRDGGTWDNNPMLYPYRSDDEVLVWEEDPFQTVTRSKWGRATLTVTRAAIIRPSRASSSPPWRPASS